MFKKLSALLSDDKKKKAPPPKSGSKAPPPQATPAAAASTAASCAAYVAVTNCPPWVRMPDYRNAMFNGQLNTETRKPVEGSMLFPSGTALEGRWNDAGIFCEGTVTLAAGAAGITTKHELRGVWVESSGLEKAINDGIGARLVAGTTRDVAVYRVHTSGVFGVYKNNYTRLLVGVRTSPRPTAPKDVPCADLLPFDQTIVSAGIMNFDKNVIGQGCVLGVSMTAGVYRMDGGVNQLQDGVCLTSAVLVEGRYRRRTDYENVSQVSLTAQNRQMGRWRRGEGGTAHMDLGARLTCYKPGTEGYSANAPNYVYCVELGRFAMVSPRRHRYGRKWYQKDEASCAVISEGTFNPVGSDLLLGVVVSNVKDGSCPVWTNKPSKDVAAPHERVMLVPGQAMRCIAGFRKYSLRSEVWKGNVNALVDAHKDANGKIASLDAVARTMPALTEEEALEVERAWYGGEQTWTFQCNQRGELFFGDHIDEGAWSLYCPDDSPSSEVEVADPVVSPDATAGAASAPKSTLSASTEDPKQSLPSANLFVPIAWEERLVESIASRAAVAKDPTCIPTTLVDSSEVTAVMTRELSDVLRGSFSDLPDEWVSLPLPRHEWLLQEVDLRSKVTRFSLPCGGVVVDAATADDHADDSLLPRLTDSDQAALDVACATPFDGPITAATASVHTSLGYVNMFAPLRFLSESPLSLTEAAALLQSWNLGTHDANPSFIVHHPLVHHARELVVEASREFPQVVDMSKLDDFLSRTEEVSKSDHVPPPHSNAAKGSPTGPSVVEEGCMTNNASPKKKGEVDATTVVDAESSSPKSPQVGRHVTKQHLTLKEVYSSSAFKESFLETNFFSPAAAVQGEAEEASEGATRCAAVVNRERLGISAVIHVPLSPDTDCMQEYRHSWGFVLEYIHWVGLRHSCVPLIAPLSDVFRRSESIRKQHVERKHGQEASPEDVDVTVPAEMMLMQLRARGDPKSFMTATQHILNEFDASLAAVAERVFVAHAPFAQRMTVAKAAPWGHGLICRFVGDQLSVTAAACEVTMWLSERGNEHVRTPSSWCISSRFCTPTAAKAADGSGPATRLFLVDPTSLEFCDVHNCLYNMQFPSLWSIVRLERVQNETIYERYVEKRRQIGRECRTLNFAGHQGCNEHRWLAHGTRGVDPMVIAGHGFDHRYSEKGLFGRAAYFAYDPVYSHTYRHETGVANEGQMFLAAVAAGNVELRHAVDKEIKHPKPGYHSVDGPLSDRFRGLMVYDLDQAYPAYLVTYRYTTR